MDVNTGDIFSYDIVGGANETLFFIHENELRLVQVGQRGNGLEVYVRVTDSTGLTCTATFVVSECCVSVFIRLLVLFRTLIVFFGVQ